MREKRLNRLKKWMFGLLIAGVVMILVAIGIYLFYSGNFEFEVINFQLRAPAGYEQLDGMKIVMFSDLHMLDSARDIRNFKRIIRRINAEKPDVILFGGDMIATDNLEWMLPPARIAARMRDLNATFGTYAVTGNHDWDYDGERVIEAMRKSNVVVLDNAGVTIPGKFNLIGLADGDSPDGPRVDRALKDIDHSLPTIALVHRPEMAALLPDQVKMIFAGHTHGGQIQLPIITDLVLKYFVDTTYSDGEYRLSANRHLYVSKGIGTSWLRLRINCEPDIIILTIKGKNEKTQ